MAELAAIGYEPIVFLSADGIQLVLPISAIYFDAAGDVHARRLLDESTPNLVKWLSHLVKQGKLNPDRAPPLANSMIVKAAATGAWGNNTVLTVAETNDPSVVDVTATITDTYPGLTLETLESVLGSGIETGSKPGLVGVKQGTITPSDPVEGQAVAVDPQTTPPSWSVETSTTGSSSFVLEARPENTEPHHVTISIEDLESTSGGTTFTLSAVWVKTVSAVDVTNLETKLDELGFAITVTPPPGGFKLPKPGAVSLAGGGNPTQASATVLAIS